MFEIPTLEEVLGLVRAAGLAARDDRAQRGQAETGADRRVSRNQASELFRALGLSMEEPLVRTLHRWGYAGSTAPAFIQSFEVGNLKVLRKLTKLPLVQLLSETGKPYDFVLSGDARTYADLVKPAGLQEIATYADAIGVDKNLIIPRDARGVLAQPTTLVSEAHARGLLVHAWTFRAENSFLPQRPSVGQRPGSARRSGAAR